MVRPTLALWQNVNPYSASHDYWCTAILWNRIMTVQCEGMGEVGSARYEPALLPPCPSIRALSYSNCQRSTHSNLRAWHTPFKYTSTDTLYAVPEPTKCELTQISRVSVGPSTIGLLLFVCCCCYSFYVLICTWNRRHVSVSEEHHVTVRHSHLLSSTSSISHETKYGIKQHAIEQVAYCIDL